MLRVYFYELHDGVLTIPCGGDYAMITKLKQISSVMKRLEGYHIRKNVVQARIYDGKNCVKIIKDLSKCKRMDF